MTKNNKRLLLGFLPSLVLPALFIMAFIYFRYNGSVEFWRVVCQMFEYKQLSAMLAVGAFPNLFLFLYSMHKEDWQLGRGVIGATLLYGVIVMVMKVVQGF